MAWQGTATVSGGCQEHAIANSRMGEVLQHLRRRASAAPSGTTCISSTASRAAFGGKLRRDAVDVSAKRAMIWRAGGHGGNRVPFEVAGGGPGW
jgi:hypothetical protein